MERREFLRTGIAAIAGFTAAKTILPEKAAFAQEIKATPELNRQAIGVVANAVNIIDQQSISRDTDLLARQNDIRRAIGIPEIGVGADGLLHEKPQENYSPTSQETT